MAAKKQTKLYGTVAVPLPLLKELRQYCQERGLVIGAFIAGGALNVR